MKAQTNIDLDALSDDFVQRCAQAWERKGLPLSALATAATTWGLQYATAEASAAEVAAGLQRMADVILSAAPAHPRHLI